MPVSEVGCGIGTNLIYNAALFPNSHFVGFDLANGQIQVANDLVKKTKLKNIEFITDSFVDFTYKYKFDYIIIHGLLSWIPQELEDSLLKMISENLSDNGVVFMNANTYPGGYYKDICLVPVRNILHKSSKKYDTNNVVSEFRDLFKSCHNYFEQRHELFDNGKTDLLCNQKNNKLLAQNIKYAYDVCAENLENTPDILIIYDYLSAETHNVGYQNLFNKFKDNKLSLFSLYNYPEMFALRAEKKVTDYLDQYKTDANRITMTQTMAFRSFESFIFGHQKHEKNLELQPQMVDQMWYATNYQTSDVLLHKMLHKKVTLLDLDNTGQIVLHDTLNNKNIDIYNHFIALFLLIISGKPMSFDQALESMSQVIEEKDKTINIKNYLLNKIKPILLEIILYYPVNIVLPYLQSADLHELENGNYKPQVFNGLRDLTKHSNHLYGYYYVALNKKYLILSDQILAKMNGKNSLSDIREYCKSLMDKDIDKFKQYYYQHIHVAKHYKTKESENVDWQIIQDKIIDNMFFIIFSSGIVQQKTQD